MTLKWTQGYSHRRLPGSAKLIRELWAEIGRQSALVKEKVAEIDAKNAELRRLRERESRRWAWDLPCPNCRCHPCGGPPCLGPLAPPNVRLTRTDTGLRFACQMCAHLIFRPDTWSGVLRHPDGTAEPSGANTYDCVRCGAKYLADMLTVDRDR